MATKHTRFPHSEYQRILKAITAPADSNHVNLTSFDAVLGWQAGTLEKLLANETTDADAHHVWYAGRILGAVLAMGNSKRTPVDERQIFYANMGFGKLEDPHGDATGKHPALASLMRIIFDYNDAFDNWAPRLTAQPLLPDPVPPILLKNNRDLKPYPAPPDPPPAHGWNANVDYFVTYLGRVATDDIGWTGKGGRRTSGVVGLFSHMNPDNHKDHMYTPERWQIAPVGWAKIGHVLTEKAATAGSIGIYELFNDDKSLHMYVAEGDDHKKFTSAGWKSHRHPSFWTYP